MATSSNTVIGFLGLSFLAATGFVLWEMMNIDPEDRTEDGEAPSGVIQKMNYRHDKLDELKFELLPAPKAPE